MMSGLELRGTIEKVRAVLESQPSDRETIDACAEQLRAAAVAVTAALEAEFTRSAESSESPAA